MKLKYGVRLLLLILALIAVISASAGIRLSERGKAVAIIEQEGTTTGPNPYKSGFAQKLRPRNTNRR